jgi:hypothetical protein
MYEMRSLRKKEKGQGAKPEIAASPLTAPRDDICRAMLAIRYKSQEYRFAARGSS